LFFGTQQSQQQNELGISSPTPNGSHGIFQYQADWYDKALA